MVSFASRPGSIYPKTDSATSPIPDELTRLDQWVCWKYGKPRSDGKREKVPINPRTGRRAKINSVSTWGTYQQALAARQEHGYDGVGFVLTPEDPYSFVDLDDVIDPETGEIEPWAMRIVETVGSYTEVSPSGRGLRIAVLGKLPITKKGTPPVEIFSEGGYVTVTGNALSGFAGPVAEAQDTLEGLYREHCQPEPSQAVEVAAREPLPDPIDLTDADLLDKARNADKLGWKFEALFDRGDTSVSKNDASAADNDLMMQLAFWTGKDANRMERLFSESALGQRDKWKSRPDYHRRTIAHAIANTRGVYEPEQHRPDKTRVRDRLKETNAYAVLGHSWKEKAGRADAGATDFFGFRGLLRLAHKANTLEIDLSIRDYMEAAGIADFTTALQSLARITNTHRLLDKVRDGGSGNAARYRIRVYSKPKHIEIRGNSSTQNPPRAYNVCAGLLSNLAGAYLIRNASPEMPEYDKNGRKIPKGAAPLVKSVGKVAAMVAYVVAATAPLFEDGIVPFTFVSERTGVAVRNLKLRHVPKLVAAGLVDVVEGGFAVPEDVKEALKEELRVSGSLAAANRQRQRHDRQRRAQEIKRLAWLGRDAEAIAAEMGYDPDEIAAVVTPPDEAPTTEEMDAARLAKSAHGEYADLEREAEHFPEVFTPDADPQHPIGHDYQEAAESPVSAPELVQRATAPPDRGEATEDDTDAVEDEAEVLNLKTGPEIVAGFGEAKDHALSCDCGLCCVRTPSYVPLVPTENVIDLEEYRRERVS